MATKRMFSSRVIGSARFLKMPISSQALYFHLGMRADDDGIVEAYTVIKTVGCTEDDLRVLVSKGYVEILNDDLVAYITDWSENNTIRADRKIDSIYKDLLIRMNPNVQLIEKRQRSDVKQTAGQAMDSPWTDNGRTMDGIDKVSTVENSTAQSSIENTIDTIVSIRQTERTAHSDIQTVVNSWNSLSSLGLSPVHSMSSSTNRYSMLKARINEYGIDNVIKAIGNIKSSSFLLGNSKSGWTITFDWFVRPNNFPKVLEGNYLDNKGNSNSAEDGGKVWE